MYYIYLCQIILPLKKKGGKERGEGKEEKEEKVDFCRISKSRDYFWLKL
jgi:hypothetical protein